jgi:hypothetical protein
MAALAETTVCFEKPQIIILKGKMDPDMDPIKDIANALEGPIRTRSMREYFGNKDKIVQYALSMDPTISELEEYVERVWIHGYGEGAVVARRHANGMRFMYPHQWGMIMHVHKYSRGVSPSWGPFQVKWLDSSEIESSWAEDLVVIHSALDRESICEIVEAQSLDVTEAREFLNRSKVV